MNFTVTSPENPSTSLNSILINGDHLSFTLIVDKDHGLCKIQKITLTPDAGSFENNIQDGLRFILNYIKKTATDIDVLYCTTLTLTLEQQKQTLDEGFELLGVFPDFVGNGFHQIQGVTAFFFNQALSDQRYARFFLHPVLEPFFKLIQSRFSLPALPLGNGDKIRNLTRDFECEPLPPIELIEAARFVSKKFETIKSHQAISNQFYPFREPNVLATDPDQKIEVFIQTVPEYFFASIIGEKIDLRIHPRKLYESLTQLLLKKGVTYIEMIMDAADYFGIQCILEAGFIPCAYFPAFKRSGHRRRDFVVFAFPTEKGFTADQNLDSRYYDFYREYRALSHG